MPFHNLLNDSFIFFQEFLKHPFQIGSVIPSSRFLERRLVEAAGIHSAKTIVELGPGTGSTTRAILRAMAQDARLLSIELNPHLYSLVSRIEDDRFIPHLGNAYELREIISLYGLGAPEVVISGIPFSTMSRISGSQILETIASVLATRGRFVAYQVSKRIVRLNQYFPEPRQVDVELELFNIPPLRVFRWEKTAPTHGLPTDQRSAAPRTGR
jgi:phosphatidylethanolamine/phosphatidyl-N-methylethanolamine N-methyltransferase